MYHKNNKISLFGHILIVKNIYTMYTDTFTQVAEPSWVILVCSIH